MCLGFRDKILIYGKVIMYIVGLLYRILFCGKIGFKMDIEGKFICS